MGVQNNEWLTEHKDVTLQVNIVAGVDPSATLIADRAGFTTYIRRVEYSCTTDHAATLTLRDRAGTPVVIAVKKASPGVGRVELLDARERGIALTEGKGLDLVASAAGNAGILFIEAYQRQTGVLTPAELASA